MKNLVLLVLLISPALLVHAQSLPELVIPVDPAEQRRLIESDPGAEIRYEELNWLSKGRIRVARIDGDVLALVDQPVQFTAFSDAEPIVVLSHGIDGYEWRASRINGRFDIEAHGGLEAALQQNPNADPAAIEYALGELIEQQNELSWRLVATLQDAVTGEYLLPEKDLEKFVINPRTGEYKTIKGLEQSARWLAEKDGLVATCAPEVRGAEQRREIAASSNVPKPPPPPLPTPPPGSARAAPAGVPQVSSFSTIEPPGCEDLGDVFELASRFSPESAEQWPYREFRPARPVPTNAVTGYSATGSIATDGNGPFNREKPANAHRYSVQRVTNHPAYVMIYEAQRRWPSIPIDDYRSQAEIDAWEQSLEVIAY